jgi:hypothetical protein
MFIKGKIKIWNDNQVVDKKKGVNYGLYSNWVNNLIGSLYLEAKTETKDKTLIDRTRINTNRNELFPNWRKTHIELTSYITFTNNSHIFINQYTVFNGENVYTIRRDVGLNGYLLLTLVIIADDEDINIHYKNLEYFDRSYSIKKLEFEVENEVKILNVST